MPLSFELVLCYYDNPDALRRWLHRHLDCTDLRPLLESSWGHLTIADTGTPTDRFQQSVNLCGGFVPGLVRYIHADTEAIRRRTPPDIHCRPTAHAMNLATDYSDRDLVIYSVLGSIPPPDWFRKVVAFHEQHPRSLLQAQQFSLTSATYHTEDYRLPMKEALLKGEVRQTTGMPDWSVRREFLLECGGWDESMVTWGMCDVDLCSRLTGKIDTGENAHEWLNLGTGDGDMPPYRNFGLEFHRPPPPEWYSVVCQGYPGAQPYDDSREKASAITFSQYLGQWGIVGRNYGRVPIKHQVFTP